VRRVLVVDDHPLVRRGVRQVLGVERPDLTVEEAGTVEAALTRLEAGPVDLAVIDVNLPGRGGLSLLEEVRRRFPEVRVLVLSVSPELEYGPRALELGAAGFVPKDSAAETLAAAVGRVLEGGRYVSPALAEWLAGQVGRPAQASPAILSERERQVLRLVASGLTLREIAVALGVSEKTVASYRSRLSLKLGLSSAVELTRFALSRGLAD
jgi:two-component system, NarL family, invasion response regulator UvrY